jgi:hypothetical protein
MLAVAEQINRSLEIPDPSLQRITLEATQHSWSELAELIKRLDSSQLAEQISQFKNARANATLVAVDRSVIDVAGNFLRSAQTISDVALDDRLSGRLDIVLTELQSLPTLLLMLQDACRRDLDYEAWSIEG